MYGAVNGKGRAELRLYQDAFVSGHMPNHNMFQQLHRQLCEKGSFTASADTAIEYCTTKTPKRSHLGPRLFGDYKFANISNQLQKVNGICKVDRVFKSSVQENDEIRTHLPQEIPKEDDQLTDEAHFWLNGYVNKQNCRIWSEANPQVYVETPFHPEKLTVWCALWADGIIGPYFFKNDEGHNVTVNGDRYRAMITKFFIPELNNHDVQELWFQQDGATCHIARATIDLLKDTFGDRLISRFRPVNWPPRSCDLTPLDYFCGTM
ncbi:putative DD41D transposase [Trichonephila clavipes]|nr:putative DD41D transposase [Trichonephila clavipes]